MEVVDKAKNSLESLYFVRRSFTGSSRNNLRNVRDFCTQLADSHSTEGSCSLLTEISLQWRCNGICPVHRLSEIPLHSHSGRGRWRAWPRQSCGAKSVDSWLEAIRESGFEGSCICCTSAVGGGPNSCKRALRRTAAHRGAFRVHEVYDESNSQAGRQDHFKPLFYF